MTYAEVIEEIEREAPATRRHLERVPEDKLGWKPAEKSMSLGMLALHIAQSTGGTAGLAVKDRNDVSGFQFEEPQSVQQILEAFDASIAQAKEILGAAEDSALDGTVEFANGDTVFFAVPRKVFLRSIVLNHTYHHRGQLSVYLRELGVPVPVTYGPTADEAMM